MAWKRDFHFERRTKNWYIYKSGEGCILYLPATDFDTKPPKIVVTVEAPQ